MILEFNDVITVTDTEQTWVICTLCDEPYQYEPGGGLGIPEECEACGNPLEMKDAKRGFWFSHEDESEIHGPFPSKEEAKSRAISAMTFSARCDEL